MEIEMKNITVGKLKELLAMATDDSEEVFVFCDNKDKITMNFSKKEQCPECEGWGCDNCNIDGEVITEQDDNEVLLGINNKDVNQTCNKDCAKECTVDPRTCELLKKRIK